MQTIFHHKLKIGPLKTLLQNFEALNPAPPCSQTYSLANACVDFAVKIHIFKVWKSCDYDLESPWGF